MPLTYTGRSVKPSAAVYPSLVDIAVGTSRQPRFAGQGKRWFSVLDHLLFVDQMAQRAELEAVPFINYESLEDSRRLWRLAALLHDAHEAITADVPTTFKGIELKQEQKKLDELIAGAFYPGGYDVYSHPTVANAVRHLDRRALTAEARVIGPDVTPERILEAFGVTDDTPDDIGLLEGMLKYRDHMFGVPPLRDEPQANHPGVREYLKRIMELM